MTRVVDTSVLYAAFDADDRRNGAALAELAKAESLLIPWPVLTEFLGLVGYRQSERVAQQAWADLSRIPTVTLPQSDIEAIAVVWRDNPDLSFTDAAGIAAARAASATLLTYDRDQDIAFRAAHR